MQAKEHEWSQVSACVPSSYYPTFKVFFHAARACIISSRARLHGLFGLCGMHALLSFDISCNIHARTNAAAQNIGTVGIPTLY